MRSLLITIIIILTFILYSSPPVEILGNNLKTHAFYYTWWGNPEFDGKYYHWAHEVMGDAEGFYPGGDDIGANFYPELGCYSCNDPKVIEEHMQMLTKAGIGVVCVTWWGKDSFEDKVLDQFFDIADKYGIKINFHIEPFEGRNADTTKEAIKYLTDKYGMYPSFYRDPERGNRPMFYVYDSYHTPAEEWANILSPEGSNTIRGTKYDSIIIGLWVVEKEEDFFLKSCFDGFYTYFASDGFTYGSTSDNWNKLSEWAKKNDKIFIPCVGPGYSDLRIRPWNPKNQRSREDGKYYDRAFEKAISSNPDFIGITSFNEWHEGTQIEPAAKKKTGTFEYKDYGDLPSDFYLNKTKDWIRKSCR